MATKIVCDVCGKEIKQSHLYYIRVAPKLPTIPCMTCDFCEDCYNEFMNHSFKEKGEKNED